MYGIDAASGAPVPLTSRARPPRGPADEPQAAIPTGRQGAVLPTHPISRRTVLPGMPQARLGRSALTVSTLGLGGNVFGAPRLDEAASHAILRTAGDLGISFIDTANSYAQGQSETFIGSGLTGSLKAQFLVATKFRLDRLGARGEVRRQVREQVEVSLRRLRREQIDLLQIHRPPTGADPVDLLTVLDDLVSEGKVAALGACNFSGWRLMEYAGISRSLGLAGLCSVQNYYNVLARQIELEVVPACERLQVGVIPYHPLGGGFLTGKYRQGEPAPEGSRGAHGSPIVGRLQTDLNWERLRRLGVLAEELGRELGEVALAWLAAQKTVSCVIVGASTPAQLRKNARAVLHPLDDSALAAVDAIVNWGSSEDIRSLEVPPSLGGVSTPAVAVTS